MSLRPPMSLLPPLSTTPTILTITAVAPAEAAAAAVVVVVDIRNKVLIKTFSRQTSVPVEHLLHPLRPVFPPLLQSHTKHSQGLRVSQTPTSIQTHPLILLFPPLPLLPLRLRRLLPLSRPRAALWHKRAAHRTFCTRQSLDRARRRRFRDRVSRWTRDQQRGQLPLHPPLHPPLHHLLRQQRRPQRDQDRNAKASPSS